MNRLIAAAIIISAAAAFLFTAVSADSAVRMNRKKERPRYVPGEVIVKFREGVSLAEAERSIRSGNHRFLMNPERGAYHLKIRDGESVDEAVSAYRRDPRVEHAQPNYYHYAAATPDDPSFSDLWWLKNTGQTLSNVDYTTNNPGTAGMDMNLTGAWDLLTNGDCSSVTVAVVDSGINYYHQDITGNMWDGSSSCVDQDGAAMAGGCPNHGWNYITGAYFPSDPNLTSNDPMDYNGHGTHVAGIIGATGNNGTGGSGICWKSKLMAVRALDATGAGTSITIMNAINFAVKNGAKIINMSVGGYQFDQYEYNAIAAARASGVLVVVAAGNDGWDLEVAGQTTYPCQYDLDNIVCVAALDQKYQLANFSNVGKSYVHVGAPGVNIKSTWYVNLGVIKDAFSTGWNFPDGGWEGVFCDPNGDLIGSDMLVNPVGWCTNTPPYPTYASNVTQTAYKTFDLSGYTQAALSFYAYVDLEQNYDYLYINKNSSGVNPYSPFTFIDKVSKISDGYHYLYEYDLTNCFTGACSIGFTLKSDVSTNYYGISIINFRIDASTPGNAGYAVENGTSMATPAATGTAAMVWAYNPSFTYREVRSALINGGDLMASLVGSTVTGKAVDARGSLVYINAPTGVTAAVK